MGGFSQQSVNDNGGVSWAKQVAQTMDPGAIDSQIQSYKTAASSLASVQSTLQNVKNNLAASWTGDAADQAQQSFQGSINHAQLVQDTISQSIIPPLQSAKAAQTEYVTAMTKVPDEQTVPSNSFLDDVGSVFGVETPAQKAESHNLTARTQTAGALNTLSDSYETSANQLTAVSGNTEGGFTPTNASGAYNLGEIESSSGDGAASSYGQRVSGSSYSASGENYGSAPVGTVNAGPSPETNLSGTSAPPVTDTSWNPNGTSPTTSPSQLQPDPFWTSSGPSETENGGNYNNSGLITDEPEGSAGNTLGGENGLGEEGPNEGKLGTSSGVFDETGLGDSELTGGSGTGLRNRMSTSDGTGLGGEGESGGTGGIAEGEGSESGMGGGSMGRGMGGGSGAGEEDLGSSKYSRGRFIGQTEEDDSSSLSPVRSVFEDATDADGNKVNMMASGRRGATPEDDEEDERNKRPAYLKEDEFWKNAERIVPPVIQ
jgi:uncharacterized protein YukE